MKNATNSKATHAVVRPSIDWANGLVISLHEDHGAACEAIRGEPRYSVARLVTPTFRPSRDPRPGDVVGLCFKDGLNAVRPR